MVAIVDFLIQLLLGAALLGALLGAGFGLGWLLGWGPRLLTGGAERWTPLEQCLGGYLAGLTLGFIVALLMALGDCSLRLLGAG